LKPQGYGPNAGLGKKEAHKSIVRVAEQPGQTINIDLLFVPMRHEIEEKLPTVSGSSGRLVVERTKAEKEVSCWPGLVFANGELDYQKAMSQYAAETRDRLERRKHVQESEKGEDSAWREDWQARSARHQLRKQREEQDANWKFAKAERRNKSKNDRKLDEQAEENWKACREQRQKDVQQRKQEDQEWHKRNQERKQNTFPEHAWIAILAIIDNCSRQCFGLPIFISGSHVTSEEVVIALQTILPDDLAFLISDQGTHFRSNSFAQLAKEKGFVHVPIYRHRPETNGIAERFVLTCKNWLQNKSWYDHNRLQTLICQFVHHYNDRPHQGLPIPGLSPNEFAKRIWTF
jgi:transposase InsO family protein